MRRQAFTLLEVIIALGILGVAMAVLVEVSRLSMENARLAALETDAAIVAESVLAELEAGTAELANFSGEWADEDKPQAEWSYQVTVESSATDGLLVAKVVVTEVLLQQRAAAGDRPASFSLVRWFQDPDYLAQFESAAETGG